MASLAENRGVQQTTAEEPSVAPFDVAKVRADFPALAEQINGRPLVYLDSAASAQKLA